MKESHRLYLKQKDDMPKHTVFGGADASPHIIVEKGNGWVGEKQCRG